MRRWVVACVLVAVAGCGGGGDAPPKPTAAEIDAAEARWRDRVDDVCLEVNREIGDRGGAAHVDAIDRTVAEGVADVRAGIREIVAVPLPPRGGDPAPAAFVAELKGLDAKLAELPGGGAEMKPAELVSAADELTPRLRALEVQAGKAALTSCMTHTERELVPNAVRRPIFVKRLERHYRRFVKRLPVYDEPASSPAELAGRLKGIAVLFRGAIADAATLNAPYDAAKPTSVYRASMRRLLAVTQRFEAFLRRGGVTISPELRRHQRAFRRAWRDASRAHGRLRWRAGLPVKPAEDAANGAQLS